MKGVWKAIAYFLVYMGLTAILQLLLSAGLSVVGVTKGLREESLIVEFVAGHFLGMTVISGILTVLVLYLVFKLRKIQVKQEWKFKKCNLREIIMASVIAFAYSFLFALCTYNVPVGNALMMTYSVDFYNKVSPMLGFVLLAANLLVVAPIAEEIALRGIVYTRVEKTVSPIVAIMVSGILFGIMHIMAGGIVLGIGAMLMGLVLSYIFYKFKSLWVCIIAHAVANLPDFILYYKPDISSGMFWGLIVFFVCLFVAGVVFMHRTVQSDDTV